ncbi:MAG: putative baseplate assembly protein [Bacillota bacterium]
MSLPVPDLDDITFEELVAEAVRLIPQYSRDWTDHNLSDPGITLVELFSWLAEMQVYSLNRITPRHYLKYLRLLGVRPEPAAAARVWVTFTPPAGTVAALPRGTRVATAEGIAFETDTDIEVIPVSLEKVIVFDRYRFFDQSDTNRRTGVFYYAFGEKAEAGAGLYLGLSFPGELVEGSGLKAEVAGKKLRLKVRLYEEDLPPVPEAEDAGQVRVSVKVSWKYWNGSGWQEFQPVDDGGGCLIKSFIRSGGLVVEIPGDIAKKGLYDFGSYFWIYCELTAAGFEIPPRLDTILLNTITATQGATFTDILGESTGLPGQEFQAGSAPVLAGSQALQVEGEGGGWNEWAAVDDLDASLPEDKHYVIDWQTGKVVFGDGVRGMIPPDGKEIKLSYRSGGGSAGNVSAGTVTAVHGFPAVTVTNPFAACGGREAESLAGAILRLKCGLKEVRRGVTAADFEALALKTPGLRVARAKALAAPGKNAVVIVVVPFSFAAEPIPGPGFLQTVKEYLCRRRLITTLVEVAPPKYVRVSTAVKIRVTSGSEPAKVRDRVASAVDRFLHPLTGGPDGEGWEFGREVYRSELYAFLTGVEGVDCVTDLMFALDGRVDGTSLICSGRHSIEAIEAETACGGSAE